MSRGESSKLHLLWVLVNVLITGVVGYRVFSFAAL